MKMMYALAHPKYSRTAFSRKSDMMDYLKANSGEGYVPQKRLGNAWFNLGGDKLTTAMYQADQHGNRVY